MSQLCPCGSGRELAACCGPCLDGTEQADTAERLVRSRYAAYALGSFAYVVETTHPDYREDISIEKLEEQTRGVHWLRLDMGPCQEQVPAGPNGELYDVAEFYAYYELEGVTRQIGERSFFARKDGRQFFVTGHLEYDRETIANEYFRDVKKGLNPAVPQNYFPNDDVTQRPLFNWRSHGHLLFSNWLNYYVYQETPYDLYGTSF